VTAASTEAGPPLARLFAIAYRSLIDGLHERLRERGWTDVRPAFGFVLLAVRDAPATSTQLAALMGTTKQAASKLVDTMVASGYVHRGVAADDGRQRPVDLTPRGRELLAVVERVYAELEREWADVIGTADVERLRRDLVLLLSTADNGTLPPVRPTW
jgi:DNA-binding MarR family transcriptional regulator